MMVAPVVVILTTTGTTNGDNAVSMMFQICNFHHNDAIMSAMVSRTTGVSIVYSIFCSGADKIRPSNPRSTGFCEGNPPLTGGFPSQRASRAENVSICSRHPASEGFLVYLPFLFVTWRRDHFTRNYVIWDWSLVLKAINHLRWVCYSKNNGNAIGTYLIFQKFFLRKRHQNQIITVLIPGTFFHIPK